MLQPTLDPGRSPAGLLTLRPSAIRGPSLTERHDAAPRAGTVAARPFSEHLEAAGADDSGASGPSDEATRLTEVDSGAKPKSNTQEQEADAQLPADDAQDVPADATSESDSIESKEEISLRVKEGQPASSDAAPAPVAEQKTAPDTLLTPLRTPVPASPPGSSSQSVQSTIQSDAGENAEAVGRNPSPTTHHRQHAVGQRTTGNTSAEHVSLRQQGESVIISSDDPVPAPSAEQASPARTFPAEQKGSTPHLGTVRSDHTENAATQSQTDVGGGSRQSEDQAGHLQPRSAVSASSAVAKEEPQQPSSQVDRIGADADLPQPGRPTVLKLSSTDPTDPKHLQMSRPPADQAMTATVSRGLAAAVAQRGGSLTIRLVPDSLGQMRIQMQIAPGSVSADLHVGSIEAQELLSKNLMALRESLQSRGMQVERLQVHFSPSLAQSARPMQHAGEPSYQWQHDRQDSESQHDAGGGESRGSGREATEDRRDGQEQDAQYPWRSARTFAETVKLSLNAIG